MVSVYSSLVPSPPPRTHSSHVFDYVHVKEKNSYFGYVKEGLHFGFVHPKKWGEAICVKRLKYHFMCLLLITSSFKSLLPNAAKRNEANNRVQWAPNLSYRLYIYIYICRCLSRFWPQRLPRESRWRPCRYMCAVFKLLAHEESEIYTSRLHSFIKEGLLQLPG